MIGGTHKSSGLGHRVDGEPRPGTCSAWRDDCIASPNKPKNQSEQIRYHLVLAPGPHCVNPSYALKGLLKTAWRKYRLRCIDLAER